MVDELLILEYVGVYRVSSCCIKPGTLRFLLDKCVDWRSHINTRGVLELFLDLNLL